MTMVMEMTMTMKRVVMAVGKKLQMMKNQKAVMVKKRRIEVTCLR